MRYREVLPAPALRHLVECYWTLERDYRGAGQPGESVWPDGTTELLFHTGDRYRLGGCGGRVLASGILLGPLTRRLELASPGRVSLVGVRFRPWGLAGVLGVPIDALTDTVTTVEDLWGADGRRLVERLGEATPEEALPLLDAFLLAHVRPAVPELRSMAALAAGILASAGRVDVRREARLRDLSPRQVERRFKRITGLSPKRLAVISRFEAARHHILGHPDDDLSDIACRFGWFDYAHLSNDFVRFLGTTPHSLRQQVAATRAAGPADVVFLHELDDRDAARSLP